MKCVAGNIILDVRQQIFVCRDSDIGRSTLPFNRESATSVDIRETAGLSFLCFDMAIAADSGQAASVNQKDTPSEQNDRDLLHLESDFSVTMRRRLALDSTKIHGERVSRAPRWRTRNRRSLRSLRNLH